MSNKKLLTLYLPAIYNTGEHPEDGLSGPPVDDFGMIYGYDGHDEVFVKTTIADLVNDLLLVTLHSGDDIEHEKMKIISKISNEFRKAADRINEEILSYE
jgi:hypothetical protein